MNKPILAAMSGVAFGLVLAVSGYHVYSHMGCERTEQPTFVRIERAAPRPCARMTTPPVVIEIDPPEETPAPVLTAAQTDAQADRYMAQARALAHSDPNLARAILRKTMQLYQNNPRNVRVRAAFRLLNRIPHSDDDSL